jgi:hypothetical protein
MPALAPRIKKSREGRKWTFAPTELIFVALESEIIDGPKAGAAPVFPSFPENATGTENDES